MTIAYVNTGAVTAMSSQTSAVCNLPSSVIPGNLLLAFVVTGWSATTHVWPAGWTMLGHSNNGNLTTSIAWRIADGTEESPTISWSGTQFIQAKMWQFSGVIADAIGSYSENYGTTSPHACPGIATIGQNSAILYLDLYSGATVFTNPSGYTQIEAAAPAYAHAIGIKQTTGTDVDSGSISSAGGNEAYMLRIIELVQGFPVEPIDADATSTSNGATTSSGVIGIAAPAVSSGNISSESSYTYAIGAFVTSSGVVSGSVSVVREKSASAISSGQLEDEVLVAFLANAAAESIATDASHAQVTRFTSAIVNTGITISGIASASRIYYEIAGSDASIGSLAESIRTMDVSVIASVLIASGAVGNASYNLVAESLAHMISGILYVNDYMDGWAYNLNNQAPSFYENFKFNSFAKIGNQYYGLASDGLHLLGANDDNGSEINAVITTGISDFGEYRIKKVPTVYAGARTEKPLELTCRVDNEPDYTYEFTSSSEGIAPTRVKLGKGLEGRYWQFEFKNRDGADFEISDLDIPITLNSRGV